MPSRGVGIMSAGAPRKIGASVLALGTTSVVLAMRARHSRASYVAQQEAERSRGIVQTSLAPVISTSYGGSAGLAVSMKF